MIQTRGTITQQSLVAETEDTIKESMTNFIGHIVWNTMKEKYSLKKHTDWTGDNKVPIGQKSACCFYDVSEMLEILCSFLPTEIYRKIFDDRFNNSMIYEEEENM